MYCKHCGNQIETDWSTCPYCGVPLEEPVNGSSVSTAPESRPPYQRWWFWVIVILAAALVVLFVLYTLGSGTEEASKPATATETTLSAEALAKQQEKKEAALRAEYIFPDSNSKYLSEEEVRSVEADQLRIGRNEIFARHGYIFKDKDLKKHFKNTSWYQGTVSSDSFDSDAVFNNFEKKNVELIKKVEDEVNGNTSAGFIGRTGTYTSPSLDGGYSGLLDLSSMGKEQFDFSLYASELGYTLWTDSAQIVDDHTAEATIGNVTVFFTWLGSDRLLLTHTNEFTGMDAGVMWDLTESRVYDREPQ